MKAKKILMALLVVIGCGTLLTGCGAKEENNGSGSEPKASAQKSKGKCDLFECMKKIENATSIEDVNEVIGFEGVKQDGTSETTTKYEWELTDDTSIEVSEYKSSSSTSITSITANYEYDNIKNSKVDLTKLDELKSRINSTDGLYYDDVKEILGGVDGELESISSYSKKYVWVNENGGYVHASFNLKNKLTFYSGIVK